MLAAMNAKKGRIFLFLFDLWLLVEWKFDVALSSQFLDTQVFVKSGALLFLFCIK
jgi:hypothetical protein